MATKKRKVTKKKATKKTVAKKKFVQGKELIYFGSAAIMGLILISVFKYFWG